MPNSTFCPECGQLLTRTDAYDERDSSERASQGWGLLIVGVLFLLAVGIRTWTASQDVSALKSQIHTLEHESPAGMTGSFRNATNADPKEEFALFRDRMRAQHRVGEAPIAAGLALIVIAAGMGAKGLPGRKWRPQNVVARGSSADQSTLSGVLKRAGRKVCVLGHFPSMATASLIAVFYSGSVGLLLLRRSAITPSLFDEAFTRTIDAIVTLAIYFS